MEGVVKLFSNFFALITPEVLLIMPIFMIIGMIIGALPGLTATMGVAILTGLTFSISTQNTFVILMAVYIGAVYGGSISAILINIPGTGAAAATLLDGHPLALKGQAGQAIGWAATASTIGTTVGMVVLAIFAPQITQIALSFTSPEFFLLALWGITICGSISTPDIPLKGWMMGLLGIFVSFVGLDKIYGYSRFTFGNSNLLGGVSFIPSMIGLFGIPEVITILKEKKHIDFKGKIGKIIPKFRELITHSKLIIRSGIIGVWIGAIPGAGEDVAAFVSYGIAKRTHKKGKLFGTGVMEGVIAAETANNACIGGALIPLLTLGIPGSPPAAVLLGAFLLHNIVPGPMLNIDHPNLISQMSAITLLGSIFLGICSLTLAKPISKVLLIPPVVFMPIVAVLCTIGSYAINLNTFDLTVMLIFGVIGYFLREMGYPGAPLVLGIILGPMADENLRRTLIVSNGSILPFFTRPISIIFIIIIVLTLLSQSESFKAFKSGVWEKFLSSIGLRKNNQ